MLIDKQYLTLQINQALAEEMKTIHALSIRVAEADSVWMPKNAWLTFSAPSLAKTASAGMLCSRFEIWNEPKIGVGVPLFALHREAT